jgi:hypothetical protein
MSYRILVTGSRDWPDPRTGYVWEALDFAVENAKILGHTYVTVVHGDCPTGVDAMAADYCEDVASHWEHAGIELFVEAHPADWAKHGKAAGPLRNQEMVDLGADICLAFPLNASRGTRDCMRRAEAAGIPVKVVEG